MSGTSLIVYLDRHHAGKAAKPKDRGAVHDTDGDGTAEREAILTGYYLLAAERRLMDLGHTVIPLSTGSYPERHAWVSADAKKRSGLKVYVAGHLNAGSGKAGGGDYGSIFHDHRSVSGKVLAGCVLDVLLKACPELARGFVRGASPDDWTRNAYGTIRGVKTPVALCYEPAFMTCSEHAMLFTREGLERMGRALADGIHAWASR